MDSSEFPSQKIQGVNRFPFHYGLRIRFFKVGKCELVSLRGHERQTNAMPSVCVT